MKQFKSSYLKNANKETLQRIIKHEGNDVVLWHPIKINDHQKMSYLIYLITQRSHDLISLLEPDEKFAENVKKHMAVKENLFSVAGNIVMTQEEFDPIKRFLDKAITDLPELLITRDPSNGFTPIAAAVDRYNEIMVEYYLNAYLNHYETLGHEGFIEHFYSTRGDASETPLYDSALKSEYIKPEIPMLLQKYGAHLFSPKASEETKNELFVALIKSNQESNDEGSSSRSSSHNIPKKYWVFCLQSLQRHFKHRYLMREKFHSFEYALTGNISIPSEKPDMEVMQQIFFTIKQELVNLSDDLDAYDRKNPMKTLSKTVLEADTQKDPKLSRVMCVTSASLISGAVFIGLAEYINYILLLKDDLDHSRTALKQTYPQCFSKERKNEINSHMPAICFPDISDWLCLDQDEPWYPMYAKAYEKCYDDYNYHVVVGIAGIGLYIVSLLTLVYFTWTITNNFFHEFNMRFAKRPFEMLTKIIGKHNPESIASSRTETIHFLKSTLELLEKQYDGDEKLSLTQTIAQLDTESSQVSITKIRAAADQLLLFLSNYSTHVKYLPGSMRIPVADLEKCVSNFKQKETSQEPTAPQSTFLPSGRLLGQFGTYSIDADEETGLLNGNRASRWKCSII